MENILPQHTGEVHVLARDQLDGVLDFAYQNQQIADYSILFMARPPYDGKTFFAVPLIMKYATSGTYPQPLLYKWELHFESGKVLFNYTHKPSIELLFPEIGEVTFTANVTDGRSETKFKGGKV